MEILSLFCEIDDFFCLREMDGNTVSSERDTTDRNTRAAAKPPSERGDDAADRLPSKRVSDVEAFLSKTRLRL